MFYARSSHVDAGIKRRQQGKNAHVQLISSQTEEEISAKTEQEKAIVDAVAAARAEAQAEFEVKMDEAAKVAEENKQRAIIDAFARMGIEPPDQIRRTGREIINEVCENAPYSFRDVICSSRTRDLIAVRKFACLAVWGERPDMSLPAIGKLVGGRDHSTILHSIQAFSFKSREDAHAFVQECLRKKISAKQAIAIRQAVMGAK